MSKIETRKYKNVSDTLVFGQEPGATFKEAIPEPQRSQLIEGGAIEDLEDNTTVPDPTVVRVTEPGEIPTPEKSSGKKPAGSTGGDKGDADTDEAKSSKKE